MFCKHEWSVLSETTTESKLEHIIRVSDSGGMVLNNMKGPVSNTDRKHIQAFTCSKCGKFKRFVERL